VSEIPDGIPIKDISFAQLREFAPNIRGWVYPKRYVSQFIPLLSSGERAALNAYGWLAMLMLPAGIALWLYLGSWWWLLLVPGAYIVWRANRKSMEDFFLERLQVDQNFYEAIRQTPMGERVKVVLNK
jgi:hypothetical protein